MEPLTGEELHDWAEDRYAGAAHDDSDSDYGLRGDILAAAASVVAALDRLTEVVREHHPLTRDRSAQ